MAETATEQPGTNEVKVEEVGPAKKRLTITVPAETINEKFEDSMGTLANEAQLPGFRKGRAPRKLLERRFGSHVRQETRNQIVADAYSQALEDESIRTVGEPEPVEDINEIEIELNQPLTFSVDVEVVPEFELPSLEGIEIKRPVLEITDEYVDRELNRQAQRLGEVENVRSDFQPHDRLMGRAEVFKKGEEAPTRTIEQAMIIVPDENDEGQGNVLGLLVDGLDTIIQGHSVGDTLTIETTVPEGHEDEELRGNEVTIQFDIRDAGRVKPATMEQIIEYYGLDDENILREQIKFALEQRRDEEQTSAMRDQLYNHLLNAIEFDLPENLSAEQARRNLEQQRMEMLYRGMEAEEVEQRLAEMRAESDEEARNRLKSFFIMHRIADQFEIEVTDQEINGHIASIAAQRGDRPEQLRNELQQTGRINMISNQIRERKAADRVLEQAAIEDISADEWQEMQEAGSGTATKKKKTSKKKKKTSKASGNKKSSKKKKSTKKKKSSTSSK